MINLKRTRLIALILGLVLIALMTKEVSCQISNEGYGMENQGGLFGAIFAPLHATIKHAMSFLGNSLDDVQGGVDSVRMQAFNMFLKLYNKTYPATELPRRMALFFDRRKQIEESVKAFREGRSPFMMRENAFVDWDENEIKRLTGVSLPNANELEPEEMAILKGDKSPNGKLKVASAMGPQDQDEDELNESKMMVMAEKIPASVDWRQSNCITTPINQQKCGACYAIATVSVVEAMRCLNQETAPILSAQQVVDCSTPRAGYQNFGCDGGWPTRVLRYLQDVRTIARDVCYPFIRRQLNCRLNQVAGKSGCTVPSSPTSTHLRYKVLNNEADILYHVANTGPVVTVMRATDRFLYYGSGIFDDLSCSNKRDDVDHAIVIVGYGRENGQDYWLIKNSWGTRTWGLDGYAKYRRGKNACSIGHWGWVVTS